MHGHQLQRVLALAGLVLAGFERGMGKEGGEVAGQFALGVGRAFLGDEIGRGVDQFVEVLETVLAFLLRLVMRAQAGLRQHLLDHLGQRQAFAGFLRRLSISADERTAGLAADSSLAAS